MPDFQLHADFDRDGLLTGSQIERAARLRFPGAIVVPNLDFDRRTLSATVTLSPVPPDFTASLPGQDNELLRIEVRGNPAALAANETLELRVSNEMYVRVALQDRDGALVPHGQGRPEVFTLPRPIGTITVFWLSVRTIAGARFARTSTLATSFQVETREERDFTLTLLRVQAGGRATEEDRGTFTVAPMIIDDRLSLARRLFIVDKDEENRATRTDVQAAATAAGVPLFEVPASLSGNDTWFQDQYQHGYMEAPDGFREIVLHLPRLRSDSSTSTVSTNLGTVVDGYFRAQDIALYNDLWDRVMVIRDATGRAARIGFRGLRVMVNQIAQLGRTADLIDEIAHSHLRSWRRINETDWIQLRRALPGHVRRLGEALDSAEQDGTLPYDTVADIKDGIRELLTAVEQSLVLPGGSAGRSSITVTIDNTSLTLTDDVARRLAKRAEQMHSGANYGGNIEATPPTGTAQLGKVIIGNAQFSEGEGVPPSEFMDPDLLNLLVKQKKQPIVEIDTSWLKVGHIDEILSVVPFGQSDFAFLHASSKAAMAILRQAEARHLAGRGLSPPASTTARQLPRGQSDRLMESGTAPVTRMFRGKYWMHDRAQPTPGNIRDVIAPPSTYLQIAAVYGRRQFQRASIGSTIPPQPGIGFISTPGATRKYPADITVSEMLWAELDDNDASSNDVIGDTVLKASRDVLASAFDSQSVFPVPVLFDRIPNSSAYRAGIERPSTTAVTPDMVNLQYLNGHILVPRPYGPRMRPADAVAVVQAAMEVVEMPLQVRSRVSLRLIRAHRLAAPYQVWIEGFHAVTVTTSIGTIRQTFRGLNSAAELIEMFRDSFPGANDAALERAIMRPNRNVVSVISGRGGQPVQSYYEPVRLRLNDGMVDLFELWMTAVVDHLGVTLHFVDTWFYHLRDGQVHCGTNTLRSPVQTGRLRSYDLPDQPFRGSTIEFEEGEQIRAGE